MFFFAYKHKVGEFFQIDGGLECEDENVTFVPAMFGSGELVCSADHKMIQNRDRWVLLVHG